ncbi:MAG: hypothetical protein ACK6DP_02745 [Gemmatimonas sp.]|jgi:hypothetical protein|uniref:hypothetical protein n=1 Tax=Gemmatimonas sp. TaxID=1962908 RepID=UPI00391F69C6|nr:hypothetical protein [Gemmatimonadota bacterium]
MSTEQVVNAGVAVGAVLVLLLNWRSADASARGWIRRVGLLCVAAAMTAQALLLGGTSNSGLRALLYGGAGGAVATALVHRWRQRRTHGAGDRSVPRS